MANRVSHYHQAVYIGPSPATGFHFIDYTGKLNNDYNNFETNHNLLQELSRVQSVNYSFETNRSEVLHLGKRGTISRINLNEPTVRLSINYLQNGIKNEARLGFLTNYAQFNYPNSGTPKYSDNYQVSLLSGFISRDQTQPATEPYWPTSMRDNRNIFLIRGPETEEVFKNYIETFDKADITHSGWNTASTGYAVMGFGHCYLDSYTARGAVRQAPSCEVSFVCENAAMYITGSYYNLPTVNLQTRQAPVNSNKFIIPKPIDEGGPSVLLPQNITLNVSSANSYGLSGLGVNFQDIKIQDYEISLGLNRQPLYSLGYKLPVDREVTFPIYANLSIGVIVGDTTSGHFINQLNTDDDYNVDVVLKNEACDFWDHTTNPHHSGPTNLSNAPAIRYDFRKAKFLNVNYSTEISSNKRATLNFSQEIDPDDLTKGLFMSGLLNIEKIENYLLINDTGENNKFFLLNEDGSLLVTDYPQLF